MQIKSKFLRILLAIILAIVGVYIFISVIPILVSLFFLGLAVILGFILFIMVLTALDIWFK